MVGRTLLTYEVSVLISLLKYCAYCAYHESLIQCNTCFLHFCVVDPGERTKESRCVRLLYAEDQPLAPEKFEAAKGSWVCSQCWGEDTTYPVRSACVTSIISKD